jgi:hypothetical protein
MEAPSPLPLVDAHAPREEVFYQGTKIQIGWDLDLRADSSTIVSLSLHLG